MVERPDEPLAALHVEHGPALHRYVLGLTSGNRALAEDVVQDTMVRAWRSDQIMDGSHGSGPGMAVHRRSAPGHR